MKIAYMLNSVLMNISELRKILRCPKCCKNTTFHSGYFLCNNCKAKIYTSESKLDFNFGRSLGERIFDFPFLYNLKINILNKLNRLKIPIDPYIKNKMILDIGCGSYQSRYNPSLTKRRVGIDPSIKALKQAQKLYPNSFHLVSFADKLPFKNKSFDVALFLFTLHHLRKNEWDKAIQEAIRVTKNQIIIYDHISNDSRILKFFQQLYWRTFDGGFTYPYNWQWQEKLKEFKIKKNLRVGSIFNHICFYVLDLKK